MELTEYYKHGVIMDIQLQELIDKIKRDGIESAAEDAAKLKTQAEEEARKIVEAARKEAEGIVEKGKADAERSEKAGEAAVAQASRNLVLAFEGEIQSLLDRIIARETEAAYNEDALKTIIPELVKTWAAKGSDSFDVLLSESDCQALSSFFNTKLKDELSKGVELKSNRSLGKGFRIANKDGSAYYDFTPESVADLFASYLNPRLAAVLKESAKEGA
jgi:V/A-type H+-transporting ATPase subunit E